jgi:hypothetical protein
MPLPCILGSRYLLWRISRAICEEVSGFTLQRDGGSLTNRRRNPKRRYLLSKWLDIDRGSDDFSHLPGEMQRLPGRQRPDRDTLICKGMLDACKIKITWRPPTFPNLRIARRSLGDSETLALKRPLCRETDSLAVARSRWLRQRKIIRLDV